MRTPHEHASTDPGQTGWSDVVLATRLLAVDPYALGGILLRGRAGPLRDGVRAWIRGLLPAGAPFVRVPLHVTEDRLLGGIALADTLRLGRIVHEPGLLVQGDGGLVELVMAERLEPHVASHLCAVIDRGALVLERESQSAVARCRLGVVALDEGIGDEHVPAALRDRLALAVELDGLDPRSVPEPGPSPAGLAAARARLCAVTIEDDAVDALCRAAWALGVPSLRAVVLAAAVARAHAALEERPRVEAADLQVAARLVLGPRATRSPSEVEAPARDEAPAAEPPPPADPAELDASAPPEPDDPDDDDAEPPAASDAPEPPTGAPALDELVLEAAKSGIPGGLLDALRVGPSTRHAPRSAGRSGATKASTRGGRPVGTIAAPPSHGARLHVLETLRAAAPWQRLRRRERPSARPGRLDVRKEDLRVRRLRQRTETCVIFAVDASGSAAQHRLAEAKGAVERVLADCYVRRDHVALIAFRGTAASLVLPPTRSLARVRRRLADLPGGGTTPLAAGIDAALALANDARASGRTPLLVLMTDGRGNVTRDGRPDGAAAQADALASSRRLRSAAVPTLLLDTATRSRAHVRELAAAMNARYLPLPHLDPAGISREIQSLSREAP